MSQENVDALKQAIAAPGLDRPDEFFAIFDEDVPATSRLLAI